MDPSPHPSLHVWSGTNFYLSEHSGSSAMLIFSPLTCPLEWSHWSANCRAGRASDPDPALVSISFYNTLQASNPCDWFLPPTFWNWEILLETVQSTLLLSFSHQKAGTSWEQGSLVSLADTQPDMYTNRILHSPPPSNPLQIWVTDDMKKTITFLSGSLMLGPDLDFSACWLGFDGTSFHRTYMRIWYAF